MIAFSQPKDDDLAKRLQRLSSADSYLTAALVQLLDAGQWEALRSQRVFETMGRRLERMSKMSLAGRAESDVKPEDLAQHLIARLGELDWLRTFIASRGTPGSYLNGVFGFQLKDAIRSLGRRKNKPHAGLHHDAPDTRSEHRPKRGAFTWSLTDLREQILRLPPANRSAVIRRHPELGLDDHLLPRGRGERAFYREGLKRLREAMISFECD